ncbi:DNA mismatch endonuclease of very short patch repair [Bradyrhizobium sp. ORS 285]|uniref:very short patch repair endonuclease n=1 Tax=Bradyrhizobium sp. ORS 285 TaxID=115808 RepID=UPI0002409B1B|nr:DNA mismatch endonuclease Vsr [Bradyrhizobium sp. ORS 285]CCD89884.1 DNA mismatch endonuclease of very short patch repair [Bradyrhizobium sp. ORS 285]SMX61491.1 DNA mismatch endonuclease of very short patch repair [Bradyrhizobium sp. ORS 285]
MADKLTKAARSALMSRVKQRHTAPELLIRSLLHRAGFRFRLHSPKLPGRPDIIFPGRRKVVFVHGCFWHGHDCRRGKAPSSNKRFWQKKISGNRLRDEQTIGRLKELGWESFIVWECETKEAEIITGKLAQFLE